MDNELQLWKKKSAGMSQERAMRWPEGGS
ncbi:hypothetical protein SAMN04488104_10767, partial [Algoriphagus faecimaris]